MGACQIATETGPGGRTFLTVEPEVLRALTDEAMHDIAHFLRPAHLAQNLAASGMVLPEAVAARIRAASTPA